MDEYHAYRAGFGLFISNTHDEGQHNYMYIGINYSYGDTD